MADFVPLVIFGARGYTAGELLRLLASHPVIRPELLVSRSGADMTPDQLQPHVAGCFPESRVATDQQAFEYLSLNPRAAIALCTGSGESGQTVAELAKAGLLGPDRVLVDLSGDFRLPDPDQYRRWYGREHPAPELLSRFDYCIPELHRLGAECLLVSNPGCFATAVQLAAFPALATGLVETDVRVFAVTGSSGSGAQAKPNTHHPFRAHEFYAYRPLVHQHTPEVLRGLGMALGGVDAEPSEADFSLVTHSAPLVRGIHVTATFRLKQDHGAAELVGAVKAFASRESMLRWTDDPPGLTGVIGSNLARLSAVVEGRRAVVFCTIDNLTRGASGQALQNLNRVLGLPEGMGVNLPGLAPS